MNAVYTEEYKGHIINIYPDEMADSPSDWNAEDWFLVYDHRDFCVSVKGYDPNDIFDHCSSVKKWFYSGYYVFPLYAYIHSGVALSLDRSIYPFNDRWDSSFKGFILVRKQKGSYTRSKAFTIADSLVNEWNDYLSGNIYGFDVEGEICQDSCYGFYGDYDKECLAEARREIDASIDHYMNKPIETDNQLTLFPQLT